MPAGVEPEYACKIGQAIAESRRARGMTQEDLRIRVGNSKNAVSNWERGVSAPTVQNLRELCRVLQVPPERILAFNDAQPRRETTQSAAAAQALVERLAALRRTIEQKAPDLIGALQEAEREARRIGAAE
jgi:transcriptional regulator with XRE-family HTH domain